MYYFCYHGDADAGRPCPHCRHTFSSEQLEKYDENCDHQWSESGFPVWVFECEVCHALAATTCPHVLTIDLPTSWANVTQCAFCKKELAIDTLGDLAERIANEDLGEV